VDPDPEPTAAPGVTGGEGDQVVGDRPLKNVQAEFNRKFSRIEDQMAQVLAALQARNQPAPTPPTNSWDQYSDEQLAELERAGSTDAGRVLTQRVAGREVQTRMAAQSRQQIIQGQLNVLFQRHPYLRDNSHPLTQAAMQAKGLLVQMGYSVGDPATDLEAIKTAIADRPDLAVGQAASAAPARPQQGIDGATTRRPQSRSQSAPALSEKELAIAKRMGIADPAKAKARFDDNQKKGRSGVSPTLAVLLREE
jgi:hypothetical protein